MDFVKEFGLTLLAGAFTMFGIEVIAHFFLNKRPFTALAHKIILERNEIKGNDPAAEKPVASGSGQLSNRLRQALAGHSFLLNRFLELLSSQIHPFSQETMQ